MIAVGLALAGIGISAYLTLVRLAGELPACGPLQGCEQVATSEYSEVLGVPVAVLGLAYSATILLLTLTWWRRRHRRALLGAYAAGLVGIVIVAYLTYLELFVIEAVCAWCVAYAITVVAGWLVILPSLRSSPADPGGSPARRG